MYYYPSKLTLQVFFTYPLQNLIGLISLRAHVCVSGVEVGTPTHFTIYTKGAGKAKPEVHFTASGPGEAVRDFEIIDNHDYSYTVKYTALQQVK